jgi:hypothetical protein
MSDEMAKEVRDLARQTERSVSWWLQRAWTVARNQLVFSDKAEAQRRRALKKLTSLRGSLKKDFPHIDSVSLAHQAFQHKK